MYKDYSENIFVKTVYYSAILFSGKVLVLKIKCCEIILLPNNYRQILIFN